jgi:small subunit ribosomal protein S8
MAMNHSISALVTCIKNGQMARKNKIMLDTSKMKKSILDLLKKEGYIKDYSVIKGDDNIERLSVELAYHNKIPVIRDIQVISKPGKRSYCGAGDIPSVFSGLGMIVLSTSKGIIFDHEAKKLNVGGELLLKIF